MHCNKAIATKPLQRSPCKVTSFCLIIVVLILPWNLLDLWLVINISRQMQLSVFLIWKGNNALGHCTDFTSSVSTVTLGNTSWYISKNSYCCICIPYFWSLLWTWKKLSLTSAFVDSAELLCPPILKWNNRLHDGAI